MKTLLSLFLLFGVATAVSAQTDTPAPDVPATAGAAAEKPAVNTQPTPASEVLPCLSYLVGVGDILEITVQEPETISNLVKVAPDGTITFVYIGSIYVKDLDIPQIQKKIQDALSKGFLKYPVVMVALKESNSKKYMVYGEINKPGAYPLEGTVTVLRAISVAGGFSRFGSTSRVKVLRPRYDLGGYDTIKIDINKVMEGDSSKDIRIREDDMIVVSEGMF